jgi:glycosyltransferase involved in cell wall biosynthesis
MPSPLISIIVPCYNEEGVLRRSIPAMLAQDYSPQPEIIFVDDGSTDNTVGIIREYMALSPVIKLLQQNHGGPAQARNLAAAHAAGTILVFNDADMIPEFSYVSALAAPIITGTTSGSFTTNELVGNIGNYWADCWCLASECRLGKRYPEDQPDESTIFRALLKTEFYRVGGYADVGVGGVGEDFTLSQKLGYCARNAPEAVCYHDNPGTFQDFFRSAAWYGKGWYAKYGWRTLLAALAKRNPLVSMAANFCKGRFYHSAGLALHDLAVLKGMLSAALGGTHFK